MKFVKLNNGISMPLVGYGTWNVRGQAGKRAILETLELGYRLIDRAQMYGNEDIIGQAVRGCGLPNQEIFLTTKLYPTQFDGPAAAINEAMEKLDIGYIGMMLLHHPGTGDVEAYHAMEQAVADGKIHSIGLSNWYVEELEGFLPQVNIIPALVQNEIHPYYQENDVIPYIQSLGCSTRLVSFWRQGAYGRAVGR